MEAPLGQEKLVAQSQHGVVIHESKDTEIQEKYELEKIEK